MLAEALFERTREQSGVALPLPMPEYPSGYGLAHCLGAAAPLIDKARDRVRRGAADLAESYPDAPFDPASIEQSLASHLTTPLLQMMSQVVVLELNVARLEGVLAGETPEERFASFVDRLCRPEFREQLLCEYPVLTEQITNRLQQWSAFSLEFLKNLCEDWGVVRPLLSGADPGPIVEVQGGAGDTHRRGRSVMIVSFASGQRVVYKPRSLAPDLHFQEMLGWLNEHGVRPEFRQMKAVDRGDHGWAEFIPAAPCETEAELRRFYERQGGYLAALYAIHACDFFCENLIAAGEHPMLIDLEALFHPRLEGERAQEIATAALQSSVLTTGLLPMRMWATKEYSGIDISGLGNSAGQLSPDPVPQWEGTNTDEMHMVRRRIELDGSRNCPTVNGQAVTAVDYGDSIAAGFASTYRLLLAHRSEFLAMLDRFADDDVRVILRQTQTYGTLLHESFHPDVLRNHPDRLALFDRLREAPLRHASLETVLSAELSDLLRGDIPLFTTHPASRDLVTSDGRVIENFFAESGTSLAERRIRQLSLDDLERQLWTVRASLATSASPASGPSIQYPQTRLSTRRVAFSGELMAAAAEIGNRLGGLAFVNNGEATWVGMAVAGEKNCFLAPLGADLYDGLPGVILFLAYLGTVSGDARHSSLAKAALQALRRRMESLRAAGPLGGFAGWGGIVYLLAHLGVLWGDSSLFTEAEDLRDLIQVAIDRDQTFDVIGGAAGCVLALLALHRCRPRATTLATARRCGEHLLRNARKLEAGIGWLCGKDAQRPLAGFAHGNAGIAYALTALAEATGEARFKQAAIEAFAYERSLYSPVHRNWPDLRPNAAAEFATAWCHGAPGIALSRLCSPGCENDPLAKQEIDAALATTAAQQVSGNHTLCHGDLGNSDILLQASKTLQEPRWRIAALQLAAQALETAAQTGWVCGNPLGAESPGLMTGLAGIGYALLRLASPARIPSVLALEAPEGI